MINTETEQGTINRLARALTELERKHSTVQTQLKAEREQVQSINQINADLEKQVKDLEQTLEETNYVRSPEGGNILTHYPELIGSSQEMMALKDVIYKVRGKNINVLVEGESGTGKELVASHLGEIDKPFVTVNCAALEYSLFESELFGHVKGSFTGAHKDQLGLFQIADGGILLLDEIGDLPLEQQGKLLRVLDNGEARPVGGQDSYKTNVRIISTTNKNLLELVQKGDFRKDLYYRLAGTKMHVTPLRDRKDDIPSLLVYLSEKFAPERIITWSKDKVDTLLQSNLKGNIRELENIVKIHIIMGDDNQPITLEEVRKRAIWGAYERNGRHQVNTAIELDINVRTLRNRLNQYKEESPEILTYNNTNTRTQGQTLYQIEKKAILSAYERNEKRQLKTTIELGIGIRTLRNRLKKYRQEDSATPQKASGLNTTIQEIQQEGEYKSTYQLNPSNRDYLVAVERNTLARILGEAQLIVDQYCDNNCVITTGNGVVTGPDGTKAARVRWDYGGELPQRDKMDGLMESFKRIGGSVEYTNISLDGTTWIEAILPLASQN